MSFARVILVDSCDCVVDVQLRLTKEMIDAMGGPGHENYQRFVKYCCQVSEPPVSTFSHYH
jgi:hypothetical protein